MASIEKLDKKIIALQKKTCWLPNCTSNFIKQLPHELFEMEVLSLKNAYLRYINKQLKDALNDIGRLGTIYRWLIYYILSKYGGIPHILDIF